MPLESLSNVFEKNVDKNNVCFNFFLIFKLLFECKFVLSPTQRSTGSKRVKVSVKKYKNNRTSLKLLFKKD